MPKIKINDISMYYEIHGQGEPIVFIAGFGADHLAWKLVVEILKHKYQLIILDNRGAGQTDVPNGPYSIEQMAKDVVALCKNLNIDKAHFVGNSMGGYILQTLAYQHASLVKSAIISNSALNTYSVFNFYREAQRQFLLSNASLATIIQASYSWLFSYRFLSTPGMLDQLIKLGLENPYPFTLIGYDGQSAAISGFDSTPWAKKIKVPVLILSSDQDIVFNHKKVKSLIEQIPQAKYFCFQECGHLPMIEFPQKFCELVVDFVKNID